MKRKAASEEPENLHFTRSKKTKLQHDGIIEEKPARASSAQPPSKKRNSSQADLENDDYVSSKRQRVEQRKKQQRAQKPVRPAKQPAPFRKEFEDALRRVEAQEDAVSQQSEVGHRLLSVVQSTEGEDRAYTTIEPKADERQPPSDTQQQAVHRSSQLAEHAASAEERTNGSPAEHMEEEEVRTVEPEVERGDGYEDGRHLPTRDVVEFANRLRLFYQELKMETNAGQGSLWPVHLKREWEWLCATGAELQGDCELSELVELDEDFFEGLPTVCKAQRKVADCRRQLEELETRRDKLEHNFRREVLA